jgi:uncharacterized protein (DUF1501 family)
LNGDNAMPLLPPPSRRLFLAGIGAVSVATLSNPLAYARNQEKRKTIIVILRGAMDGLSALPKMDDPFLAQHRASLIPDTPMPVQDGFALHPALKSIHGMLKTGDGVALPAIAGPWRERSHFEAQDLLESGTQSTITRDGWLNRALQKAPPVNAISIGPVQPLVLRGAAEASSWSPPALPEASDDTTMRLLDLYTEDPLLGPALAQAVETDALADGMRMQGNAQNYAVPLTAAGRLLAAEDGPDVAVVSLDGWDTHARQMPMLNTRFRALDDGITKLKEELGPHWPNTLITIVTEFGRTVRENGAKGSDHGTAGVAFVLGGAVKKAGMAGDWPGLAPSALYENRDLAPANDMRALLKGVLQQQIGVTRQDLDQFVFPDSSSVAPLTI